MTRRPKHDPTPTRPTIPNPLDDPLELGAEDETPDRDPPDEADLSRWGSEGGTAPAAETPRAECLPPEPAPRVGYSVLYTSVHGQECPGLVFAAYPGGVVDIVSFHRPQPTPFGGAPQCSSFHGQVPFGEGRGRWRWPCP